MADLALEFLRTDLEYEWPERSTSFFSEFILGLWHYYGIPLLVVSLLFVILDFFIDEYPWGFVMWIVAAAGALAALPFAAKTERADAKKEWCASGAFDVWPFLRRSQFENAPRLGSDAGVT